MFSVLERGEEFTQVLKSPTLTNVSAKTYGLSDSMILQKRLNWIIQLKRERFHIEGEGGRGKWKRRHKVENLALSILVSKLRINGEIGNSPF